MSRCRHHVDDMDRCVECEPITELEKDEAVSQKRKETLEAVVGFLRARATRRRGEAELSAMSGRTHEAGGSILRAQALEDAAKEIETGEWEESES